MGKKTPKAPTPPDPGVVAAAQTGMNKETAIANANLNRLNQITPEGSLTFQQIGTNADGTPQYQSTQSYSPEQQAIYNTQNQVSQALSNLSLSNVNRVNAAQSTPFSYAGMTPLQTTIPTGAIKSSYDPGGTVKQTYDTAGGPQRSIGDGGAIQKGYADAGQVQSGYGDAGSTQAALDYSGLQKIPGLGDFGAEAKRAQDAVYSQATSRLDPRFQEEQRQLSSQLAGKGVTENSEAYRRAMDEFARQKTDAYNQATYSSIGAGGQEQSRLFGLAMGARQQGAAEVGSAGQFANQSQQQRYQQLQERAAFANQAQQQTDAQNLAHSTFANQAQAQQFGQGQAMGEFANDAQAQAYAQNQSAAAFANQAQQQQYAQNAAQAAFGNMAQGQAYNQSSANAAFNNQARQQQIQEATYLRNLPLNEISALMGTAGGVAQPQFADYANVGVANTDYSGLVQNQFNNQNALYQQQLAQKQALQGQIFGLAGAGAAAAMSDRRVKENIKAIGVLANGIKTYVFNYIGQKVRQFGVMADEVFGIIPSAVIIRPDGYLMVDYRKVW